MNKPQKIIIGIYVAVCFLVFLAFLLWYFKFTTLMLDAFAWGEVYGDYSKMDSLLRKMFFSDILSWIILAIPAIVFYKIYGRKK